MPKEETPLYSLSSIKEKGGSVVAPKMETNQNHNALDCGSREKRRDVLDAGLSFSISECSFFFGHITPRTFTTVFLKKYILAGLPESRNGEIAEGHKVWQAAAHSCHG